MSNPDLHPVWAKVLGIAPEAARSLNPPGSASPLTQAIAAMTGASGPSHGWQATHRQQRPGAPVGIKKRLSPSLWISTVVTPGDARYPTHF
ncbi:hypothetical protein [Benzoatithermus flavus]|uniref:Uncharacterized protein n=1 Tax=Benzoatithermus flavus TaxID=3108223 RepID=A0ABU8Y0K8_9PROT